MTSKEVTIATRRTQTSRESRELLLSAAGELFAEKGYRETTFADIATRAEISRGSIPWHFGNKEGLLGAVLQQLADDLDSAVAGTSTESGSGTVLDRLHEDLARILRLPTATLFITLLVEALEPDSPAYAYYVDIQNRLREHIRTWAEGVRLRDGITPDDLAVTVVGAGIGIHQQWRLTPSSVDLDRALATLQSLITGALVPESA